MSTFLILVTFAAAVIVATLAAVVDPNAKKLTVTIQHGEDCDNKTIDYDFPIPVIIAPPPMPYLPAPTGSAPYYPPSSGICPIQTCCSFYCSRGDYCNGTLGIYIYPQCQVNDANFAIHGQREHGADWCTPSDGKYGYGDYAFSPECRNQGCTMAECGGRECPQYGGQEVCTVQNLN